MTSLAELFGTQPYDFLIGCRPVPTTRCNKVGELDYNGGAAPSSFELLDLPTVYVESASERPQRLKYDCLLALGDNVASACSHYFWPQENRHKAGNGKIGILLSSVPWLMAP